MTMVSTQTIRSIKVRYESEGADRARADAEAVASSHANLATQTERAAVVTEQSARRQLSAASSFERLRTQVDETYRAQQRLERGVSVLDRAFQQGVVDATGYDRTLGQLQARYGGIASAADRAATAQRSLSSMWKDLSDQGSAASRQYEIARARVEANAEASRRLGSLGSPGSRPANENVAGRRLRSDEVTNLMYQGGDVAAQLGSGSPLSMIALQQGPQIAQIFAGPGGASVKGAFGQASEAAVGLAARVGILGGAVGVLGTAALTASVAWYRFDSAQKETERALMGVGRASGATVGQISDIATAAAATGEISTREARAMANAFAATGQIGVGMFGGLIESTRGYAKIMGQDLATAQAAVAQAFADPEKGAVTLNRQLLILNATQLENIQTMARQGDRLGATAALQAALAQGVKNASELTTGWGHAFEWLGNKAGSAFDAIGRGMDRFLTGGDVETRIKDLQAVLSTMPEAPGGLLGMLGVGAQRGALQTELDELLRRQREAQQRARQGQGNADSVAVQAIMDRYNPARKQLEQLENDASDIESKLGNVELDKRGEARRQMEALREQAKALRNDLSAGGQALADSLRNAQFENRMVGAVGYGRSAADINKQQDDLRLQAMRSIGTDTNLDQFNKQVAQIEEQRKVLLDTLNKSTTQTTAAVGGAFSRMSAEVQQQLLAGSQRFPRVPVGVAAAIAQAESSGNLDVGRTGLIDERGKPGTAFGLGQITASTGADLQRRTGIDRTNRATMGEALAGVLDMKIEQANGDLFKALMNYRGSRDPAVNRAYATNILRQAGQLGDPSTQAVGAAQDAASRATRDQTEALRRASELYGVNTEKLNSVSDAQAKYNALIDAGMAPNEELRKTLLGLASAAERANRDVSLVQFRRDNAFERDQLGRTDPEARAYSAARSRFGDVNDPRARTMIGESMETNRLQEMKYTVGDTIQGFVTDLRRATSPLDALANAANRVADKLLGKFIDSFVSSAFGSAGPLAGAGGGDLLKSIWPFANGGIMTGAGPLPLRAYSVGGIARTPQLALHGEGSMPEAYVPLPDGRSIPVTVQAPANINAPAPAQPAQVTIINNSGHPVERRTVNGPRGPREEIIIGKAMASAMASGELDDVMRRRYGQKATG